MGYPKQYRHQYNGMVVLFTDRGTGEVIHPGGTKYAIGYTADDLVYCTNTERWMPIGNPADTKRQILHKTVSNLKQTN